MADETEILLVYDKQCPACNNYCQMVRIRESIGQLQLIDARENSQVRDDLTAMGWDIDEGMVLKVGPQFYYGADAIHALSLMSSRTGWFNRLNYHLFKSKIFSAYLYPVLRACRGVLLKLLRKTKINNLNISGNDRF